MLKSITPERVGQVVPHRVEIQMVLEASNLPDVYQTHQNPVKVHRTPAKHPSIGGSNRTKQHLPALLGRLKGGDVKIVVPAPVEIRAELWAKVWG
jgi:hypothetical protein